ncbi:tyrosine-protein phosphatase [Fimbriiglobus ruber]|uniref:tyrosine-protein phosphatase n=1 Tax=Fimbriiglobus ruber TaxID=1908690 RepID=UPI00137AAFB5|nr:tyrosine-protein phosphatase [Fimbriiglobus ruber]
MSEPSSKRSWLRRSRVLRWATVVIALGMLAVGYRAVQVFAGTNRHEVVEGRVYRSAQPTGPQLNEYLAAHHIRTVVNLRGAATHIDEPRNAWYRAEVVASHDHNVSQEDITLSARLLPPPVEMKRLVDVLDHTEYPVLFHCKQGADRTGLASTLYLLLYTDATPAAARRQLWPVYGHIALGATAPMDEFFDRYEDWLADQKTTHSPDRLRHWLLDVYSPGPARSELIWLEKPPDPVPVGRPFAARIRAVNRSTETWEFKPGNQAGIHLQYGVGNEQFQMIYRGEAGLFRATVAPGESIDLVLAVPSLKTPGRYALAAEMIDGTGASVPVRQNSFVKFGDESVMTQVNVK